MRDHSIPPLIICRFILDLRQVKPAGSSWVSGNQSQSLRFVGNMGETLQFGGDDDEDNELVGDEHPAQAGILPDITIVVDNLDQSKEGGYTHVRGNLDVQQVRSSRVILACDYVSHNYLLIILVSPNLRALPVHAMMCNL